MSVPLFTGQESIPIVLLGSIFTGSLKFMVLYLLIGMKYIQCCHFLGQYKWKVLFLFDDFTLNQTVVEQFRLSI